MPIDATIINLSKEKQQEIVEKYDAILLDEKGRLKLLPASTFEAMSPVERMVWCKYRGRYGLPCIELVEFVKGLIGGMHAIEIGAGMGDLGRHLGIKMTDSAMQTEARWKRYYEEIDEVQTDPPPDVERMEAAYALRRFKPEVVVASWVTQKYKLETEYQLGSNRQLQRIPKETDGCLVGVDEEAMFRREHLKMYIFIGNGGVHGQKRILSRPHEEYRLPFVFSRSLAHPNDNLIWVWKL